MGLAAHEALLLPGCARFNVLDVGDRRSVRMSGANVQSARPLSQSREGGELEFAVSGTLGLSKMAVCGRDALDFTGTQALQAILAARPRYNAAKSTPPRWLCAVVFSTTFASAGFPLLVGRYTGTPATSQYLMLHRNTTFGRPTASIFEAGTTTERGAATAVGATGSDGLPHIMFLYCDGVTGSMNVYVQLDDTARQNSAIAGTHDPGAATVLAIGGAGGLFAQAKIGAVIWGDTSQPTQAAASLLRWARGRWRVA